MAEFRQYALNLSGFNLHQLLEAVEDTPTPTQSKPL
jgi:hypothetical protein